MRFLPAACLTLALTARAVAGTHADAEYRQLLTQDDAAFALREEVRERGGKFSGTLVRARLLRVEAGYKEFLRQHPQHAPAMTAYGGFLYDTARYDEAVRWWEKAIAADPASAAHAHNSLGTHFSHAGRAADALRHFEKAFALEPREPVFRFNWALTCSMFRTDAQAVYGWDTDEIFRRSLEQFRQARDLAPREHEWARAYAETFYLAGKPDWEEARSAWLFCLNQPLDPATRQDVCGQLARVCLRLHRPDEAQGWIEKINLPEMSGLRRVLERNLAQFRTSGVAGTSGTSAPSEPPSPPSPR